MGVDAKGCWGKRVLKRLTRRYWDKTVLGQKSVRTKRCWDKTVLGQKGIGTERYWDKMVLWQKGIGTMRYWDKTVLGQMGIGTKRCWDRAILGQGTMRKGAKGYWDQRYCCGKVSGASGLRLQGFRFTCEANRPLAGKELRGS